MYRFAASCASLSIALLASVPFTVAQAQVAPPVGSAADTSQPDRWPMYLPTVDGQITVFQPQLEAFAGDKLSARAAVSVAVPNQQEPAFGSIWPATRVATDRV